MCLHRVSSSARYRFTRHNHYRVWDYVNASAITNCNCARDAHAIRVHVRIVVSITSSDVIPFPDDPRRTVRACSTLPIRRQRPITRVATVTGRSGTQRLRDRPSLIARTRRRQVGERPGASMKITADRNKMYHDLLAEDKNPLNPIGGDHRTLPCSSKKTKTVFGRYL